MTFSPGDVVRLRCGGPAMVVQGWRAFEEWEEVMCLWIVHTMVAREWFAEVVLEMVGKPSKDIALDMWAAGAVPADIVKASGYADANSLKQTIFKARKDGDARAVLRAVGRKRKARDGVPASEPEDPLWRMEP